MGADVKPLRTAAETALITRFQAAANSLPGDSATGRRRTEAFDRFGKTGFLFQIDLPRFPQ